MRRWVVLAVAAVAVLALVAGGLWTLRSDDGEPAGLPTGGEHVELDPAGFVARIDNRYWPMAPGSRWVYRETDGQGGEQRVEVTVTDRTKEILGIPATVVHDVVTQDGELVEDTWDWYAQDRDGNVWYLGEDTKEYEDGEVVSTAGSWEAGVDGAEAGVLVPGEPQVGQAYRQEHLAGEAEDRGEILSLGERVRVPFGEYEDVLQTEDTTPLDPEIREHKFYAPGVGPVLVVDVAGSGREELVEFEQGGTTSGASARVAEPPTAYAVAQQGTLKVVSVVRLGVRDGELKGVWIDARQRCDVRKRLRVAIDIDLVDARARTTRVKRAKAGRVDNCAEGGPNFGFDVRPVALGLGCPDGRWKPGRYSLTTRTTDLSSGLVAAASLYREVTRPC